MIIERHLRPFAAVSLALALAARSLTAAAQDPPSAAELRDKARASLSSGDVSGACLLFEQSLAASKAAGSTVSPDDAAFDLADCHEKQGKRQTAQAEFEQLGAAAGARSEDAKRRAARLSEPPPPVALPPGPPPQIPPDMRLPPPPPGAIVTQQEEAPTRIGDFMD